MDLLLHQYSDQDSSPTFGGEKVEPVKDKSTFHGKEERDYQGRSWIVPPKDAKASNDHCFIPKRMVHTWSGHTKGVSAIQFFPKSGHLILSAGMNTKVKIWDVSNTGKCMRTYM
jgi:pre-mRNA-processing factor 17